MAGAVAASDSACVSACVLARNSAEGRNKSERCGGGRQQQHVEFGGTTPRGTSLMGKLKVVFGRNKVSGIE